jgi:hypothetical protein
LIKDKKMAKKMYVAQKVSVIAGKFCPIGETIELEEVEAKVYIANGFLVESTQETVNTTEAK